MFQQLSRSIKVTDHAVLKLGAPALRQVIQQLCREDFLVFMKIELGFEIGEHHKLWAKRLQTGQDTVEMAPRDHGKSASMAQAYPIWRIKYSPWVREVMLLGADQALAIRNLDKIKELLETRPSLEYLLPRSREQYWSRKEIKLSNGKTMVSKGIGSPLRGNHPQLIVLDDVLNERNSLTPENRMDVKNYVNHVVLPMKDKGLRRYGLKPGQSQLVMIGTAQDREDLYHELQASGEYLGEKMKAIIDDEKQIVLWPERYSFDDLMAIKRKIGSLAFAQEYMNEPISEETSLFPPSLFEPLKDHNLSYVPTYNGGLPVYMGVDFSVPGSQDKDWTVIFVAMWDRPNNQFTVLNFWRARPTQMADQLHEVELWCQKYNVTLGFLEANLFQRVYAQLLNSKTSLPLSAHHVGANKTNSEYGLLSFRPQFENNQWRFPYKTELDKQKTDEIVLEWMGVVQRKGKIGNESYHDDICMAQWHCMMAARQGASFSVSWADD